MNNKEKREWLEKLIGEVVTIHHKNPASPKESSETECMIKDVGVKLVYIDSQAIASAGSDGGCISIDNILGFEINFLQEEIQQ